MLGALTILLACQLGGEVFARGLGLPVPGPVIGLVILAAGLWFRARRRDEPSDAIEQTEIGKLASGLLANLGLLFVPAGVGVVQQLSVFSDHGVAIAASLIGSTVLTLVVTVAIFRLAKRLKP